MPAGKKTMKKKRLGKGLSSMIAKPVAVAVAGCGCDCSDGFTCGCGYCCFKNNCFPCLLVEPGSRQSRTTQLCSCVVSKQKRTALSTKNSNAPVIV